MTVPEKKKELISATEKEIVKIERQYKRGFLTNDERYRLVVKAWEQTTKDVTDALMAGLDRYNPIWMMADSGARGSYRPDPSAGRHARPDGRYLRPHHRDPHQGQLP